MIASVRNSEYLFTILYGCKLLCGVLCKEFKLMIPYSNNLIGIYNIVKLYL